MTKEPKEGILSAKLPFGAQSFGTVVSDMATRAGALCLECLSSHTVHNQLQIKIQYNSYTG
jgi:hypothetical protein